VKHITGRPCLKCGPGQRSRYGRDSPGIESRWESRFFASVQTGPGSHPAPHITGTGSFPGIKRLGVALNTHPYLRLRLKKENSSSGTSWPVLGWTWPVPTLVRCTLRYSVGQGTANSPLLWGPIRRSTLGEKYEYNVRYDITVCSRAVNGMWDQYTLKTETIGSETSVPTCQTKWCSHETRTWAFKWSDLE